MSALDEARSRLLNAAGRAENAYTNVEEHPSDQHGGDEVTYAQELLALAARDLVDAVNALPAVEHPVGWNRRHCDTCGKRIPDGEVGSSYLCERPCCDGKADEDRTIHHCAHCVATGRMLADDEVPF